MAVAALAAAAVSPAMASAAPHHNYHLSLAASPNPIIAGEGVLIYGQLKGPDNAGQLVRLYHHVADSGRGYTLIGTTTTDASGYYEFTRQEGVVYTNRSWFVRGPDGAHSHTVYERVAALVSMSAGATSTDTARPVVFTGAVTPDHAFQRVFLQEQVASSDDWRTLTSTQLDGASHYALAYRWPRPGVHDVRVLLRGDARNLAAVSDPTTITVEQAQVPGFTIGSSASIAPAGSSVTISGVLDQAGTSTPERDTVVQLWGHTARSGGFVPLSDGTTGSDGSYQFTQAGLSTNTVYQVRTMRMPHTTVRRSALLYQGVQDVVAMHSSTNTAAVGQTVTFTGTVLPDKAGHVVYLQELGRDGDWHTIRIQTVHNDSTFQFAWRPGESGTFSFRARITSDGLNVGEHSTPVTVTVTLPPESALPPAS